VLNAEMGNKKFYGDEVGVRKAWWSSKCQRGPHSPWGRITHFCL